jgi:glutaredoxin
MTTKQQIIEIFSSGCPLCHEAIELVRRHVGSSAEIIIHNMMEPRGFGRATALGVRSVPAVAIDGKLASCCSRSGVDIQILRDAGLKRDPFH